MAFRAPLWPALVVLASCSKGADATSPGATVPEGTAPEAAAVPLDGAAPVELAVQESDEASTESSDDVLFGLATRDFEIWLHAGSRYTIKDKDGTVLASRIDQERFEQDYPELAADLSRMVDSEGGVMHIGLGGDER